MEKCELCPMAGSETPCAAWVPVRHEPFCRHLREGRPEYLPVIRRMSDLAAAWIAAGSPLATPDRPFSPPPPPPPPAEPEGRWPGGPTDYEAPPGDGRITVVIPTRDRPRLVGRAIRSVLAQTRRPARVIVVKNGPDHEGAYREALGLFLGDPTLSILWRPDLVGLAVPINAGLAGADTEYAAVLDDDDEWRPDFLETLAGALDRDRSLGLAYCDADHPGQAARWGAPPGPTFLERLAIRVWFGWSQAVWRRDLLAPGDLAPEAGGGADWDAWLRIAGRAGVYRAAEILATHHWHGGNASLDLAWLGAGCDWVRQGIASGRYARQEPPGATAEERMVRSLTEAQRAAVASCRRRREVVDCCGPRTICELGRIHSEATVSADCARCVTADLPR
jgi:hypothetical protein